MLPSPPFRPGLRRRSWPLVLLLLGLAPSAPGRAAAPVDPPVAPPDWNLLPVEEVGARSFRAAHPEWDGRGVVIGILDSGIDLDVPGLDALPRGGRKILDARDFSGQGDVPLVRAVRDTLDGRPVLVDGKKRALFGVDRLAATAGDSVYWIGFLEEKDYRTSAVKDLNNNGSPDDRFGVVAFAPSAGAADSLWMALIDLDADGQLDDETPIRSYGVSGDRVRFRSSTDTEKLHALTGGVTILPGSKTVEIHLADNGHGTHVAGIAAGWRLGGNAGLDGVAPGAELLSLKIGNNALTGGATTTESVKKAIRWALDWAAERKRPIVFNMSYGIGSVLEGQSDVDRLVDATLLENRRVVFVTSAGNDGPGLSSIGTPGTSRYGFSVGNMISDAGGPEQSGAGIRRDLLSQSSSRGGEVAKPSVIAPGIALSTVPPFDGGEIKSGTSMASPHVAGVMALLVGAAGATGTDWNWATLQQAVRGTARPLPGFTPLDQGGGLVDAAAAWEAVRGLAGRAAGPLLSYKVEATSPFDPTGKGPAAFWRNGGWFPAPPREVAVTLSAAFATSSTPDERVGLLRGFDLQADVPWIRLDRKSTYLKGEGTTSFDLEYDPAALREPGLYVGRVRAFAQGLGGPRIPEWEVWNTVIVPWRFDGTDGSRTWTGRGLEPGGIVRHFIEVPPGASSFELSLAAEPGSKGQARVLLFDPDGFSAGSPAGFADAVAETKHAQLLTGGALRPGTWEAVVCAATGNRHDLDWRLEATIGGLEADPDTLRRLVMEPGERPTATGRVTNRFDRLFEGSAEGRILGYRRERTMTARDTDAWEMPFSLSGDLAGVTFDVTFDKALYNRTTDIVLSVLDAEGLPLQRVAFDNGKGTLRFTNPKGPGGEPVSHRLELRPGFTEEASSEKWSFRLVESYERRDPESITVKAGSSASLTLYPGAPVDLTLAFDQAPRLAPDGATLYGEILFRDSARKKTRFAWPIDLEEAP